MMNKVLICCCAFAVASAGYASPYYYNQGPLETPEVQIAKSLHFAAHAAARSRSGPYAGPVAVNSLYGYAGVGYDGQPLDTPEVAAAKLQHYHDYNVAAQRNGVHAAYALPSAAVGHPIDTPEVQLAKAAHFAAHAEATARNAGAHYRRRRAIYSPYPQQIPVIDHNGVPLDTPEVSAAKAQHFAEYAKAAGYSSGAPAPVASAYAYPQHIPVIGPNGVPLDTPEVQQAKAAHFAAHAGRGGPYYSYGPPAQIGPDGQPIETYEVQAAKAAHFAAHATAKVQNLHY